MGEQPLHIVPLFKYADESNTEWEYYVPHWINLSYFRTDHGFLSSFTPRIRVPDLPLKSFSQIERKSSKLDLVPEEATSANGVHSGLKFVHVGTRFNANLSGLEEEVLCPRSLLIASQTESS
jgi:hypothetical protein